MLALERSATQRNSDRRQSLLQDTTLDSKNSIDKVLILIVCVHS